MKMKMMSITEEFVKAIVEAQKSAVAITDPNNRAMAYIGIAQALAQTGQVTITKNIVDSMQEIKQELKEPKVLIERTVTTPTEMPKDKQVQTNTKKEDRPSTEKKTKEDPPLKETSKTKDTASKETEVTKEWTDKMELKFKEEISFLKSLKEEYEEQDLIECVKNFSEGDLTSLEDINPLNIKGFTLYMKALIAQAEEEE